MFSIGEFSKISGLPVKTLRFYQEQGILQPTYVESGSGYRFYAEGKIETARVIRALRELEFSIAEIREILSNHDDDSDIVSFLKVRKADIQQRIKNDRRVVKLLDEIVTREQEANETMKTSDFDVEQKQVESILVASIRMTGKYSDCGKGFGKIGRKFGRHICGKAMMFCHDSEYRENDANFEVAMPIRKGESTDQIAVKEIPGGRCVSVMHLGSYDDISRSYEKILKYLKQRELDYEMPTREVYHKGPGMIFKGNPKKYLTEIQFMLS